MNTLLRIKPALAGIAAAAALAAPAPASAVLPQVGGTVDLASWQPNTAIDGAASYDQTGDVLANAGDVNGDGLADVMVAARYANPNGRKDAGTVFVVFGREGSDPLDLAGLQASGRGFRIDGAANYDRLGSSVARAGDMNDDGLSDLIVGAREADNRGRSASGSAYVVFGKPTTGSVDLRSLGTQGFRIDGPAAGARAGSSVSGAGDVNGDGTPDVMLGAPLADQNARTNSGTVFVVFGKRDPTDLDAAALGDAGYAIDGAAAGDQLSSVASVRDFDADGRTDVFAGARLADPGGRFNAGAAYVVPGKDDAAAVDLAIPQSAHHSFHGATASDMAGSALAQGGDLSGDGRSDLLLGAPGTDFNGRSESGSAYVLTGADRGGETDLAASSGSWRIDGAAAGDATGTALDAAADVNSDGRVDLAVGSPLADRGGSADAGAVRVLYGGGFGGSVDLATSSAPGYRVTGGQTSDRAGSAVAFVGDANGDARADLLVGAPLRDHRRRDGGTAYFLWGYGTSGLDYPAAATTTVGQPIPTLAPDAIVRTGSVTFSISPALPAGLTLDPRTGVISGAPTAIQEQPTTYTLTMTDLSGSVSVPVTLRVAPLPGRCANARKGSPQADALTGTGGGDLIEAYGGNDNIQAVAGDDCVIGDAGVDTIAGGDGADEVRGGGERDVIDGGFGDDQIFGDAGVDELTGGDGADRMRGGTEHDALDGGLGDDELFGEAGQDTLAGGGGNDALSGGTGFDDLAGGDGNDRLFGQGDSDALAGGNGNDRVEGGDSADRISGGGGNDVLKGGGGNDIITDAGGANRVAAGPGSDVISIRNGKRDVVNCGGGKDRVTAERGDKLKGCEKVRRVGSKKRKRRR